MSILLDKRKGYRVVYQLSDSWDRLIFYDPSKNSDNKINQYFELLLETVNCGWPAIGYLPYMISQKKYNIFLQTLTYSRILKQLIYDLN